jgi:hypothetical protein
VDKNMADDSKRNALFSKLLTKEKPKADPETKSENTSLDELMAFDENTSFLGWDVTDQNDGNWNNWGKWFG